VFDLVYSITERSNQKWNFDLPFNENKTTYEKNSSSTLTEFSVFFFSLDARNGSMLHWAVGSDLGGRSYFMLGKNGVPGKLRITRTTEQDQGIFRCRVDFTNSPTRNFKLNVTFVGASHF